MENIQPSELQRRLRIKAAASEHRRVEPKRFTLEPREEQPLVVSQCVSTSLFRNTNVVNGPALV